VAADAGNRLDQAPSQFIGQGDQPVAVQALQIVRSGERVQKRIIHARPPTFARMVPSAKLSHIKYANITKYFAGSNTVGGIGRHAVS
jgi:hypothetical protein